MKVNQKPNKLKDLASILLIILPVLFSVELSAQDCNCNTNFEWLKKTFEENDAGFQYALERKGEIAYQLHNQLFSKRLKRVRTNQECLVLLNDWTTFFRKNHLVITSLKEKSIKAYKERPLHIAEPPDCAKTSIKFNIKNTRIYNIKLYLVAL